MFGEVARQCERCRALGAHGRHTTRTPPHAATSRMAQEPDPSEAPKRRRMSPAKKPKLGTRVHDRKRSHIRGQPNGRPKTDSRLKDVILNCLRRGLLLSTAMDFAGIGAAQLDRWRDEQDDEGITFGQRMREARAHPRVRASKSLMRAMGKAIDDDGHVDKAALQAVLWYLGRTPDFAERIKADPQDQARQIRAFVSTAFKSQVGQVDAEPVKFDEDDLDDMREDG